MEEVWSFLASIAAAIAGRISHSFRVAARPRQPLRDDQPAMVEGNIGGGVREYLSAAPSIGTWQVGDRVWFTAPTAGGNIGAVCVTAGTPGTWKTSGAIAA